MRIEGHGEGLFDVCGKVRNVVVLKLKLPDGNLPALLILDIEERKQLL